MNISARMLKDYQVFQQALGVVSPIWPLDQMIAVNPWSTQTHQPIEECLADVATLSTAKPLSVPQQHNLHSANKDESTNWRTKLEHVPTWLSWLSTQSKYSGLNYEVLKDLGTVCQLYFCHSDIPFEKRQLSLHEFWQKYLKENGNSNEFYRFTQGSLFACGMQNALIENVCSEIRRYFKDSQHVEIYLKQCVYEMLGWMSWCKYLNQGKYLNKYLSMALNDLLLIRVSYDLYYLKKKQFANAFTYWRDHVFNAWSDIYQKNLGIIKTYFDQLIQFEEKFDANIYHNRPNPFRYYKQLSATPHKVSMIFCIDVRSERIRRHIEKANAKIATHGCAGFFGLPIAIQDINGEVTQRQLPGVVDYRYVLKSECTPVRTKSKAILQIKNNFLSCFNAAETLGIFYGLRLFKEILFPSLRNKLIFKKLDSAQLYHYPSGEELNVEECASLLANILKSMSMTHIVKSLVYFVGHFSQCENNPQEASLHCGACGGQSGWVNVKLLAALLNKKEVRLEMKKQGLVYISEATYFVAAEHETTTEKVHVLDFEHESAVLRLIHQDVIKALDTAGDKARLEKLQKDFSDTTLEDKKRRLEFFERKASSPAELRPEWGLAGNAGFILGPRAFSAQLNLNARVFLHDYNCDEDLNAEVMSGLLNAPVFVAHWINMQYFASTVDNDVYGSGNKQMHNVLGNNVGLISGVTPQLRVGLSWQSVHDGKKWMHEPLRLSLWIIAPTFLIDKALKKAPKIRELLDNNWLRLTAVDPKTLNCNRYQISEWRLYDPE